jgi:hypothetical protein
MEKQEPTKLSPAETAAIKKEIKALEEALGTCTDSGIRQAIDVWLRQLKQKLAQGGQHTSGQKGLT